MTNSIGWETDPSSWPDTRRRSCALFARQTQVIRAAPDERDFYQLKGLGFEKLRGDRAHQRSIRLDKQWRLILEFEGSAPNKVVRLIGIEDYH